MTQDMDSYLAFLGSVMNLWLPQNAGDFFLVHKFTAFKTDLFVIQRKSRSMILLGFIRPWYFFYKFYVPFIVPDCRL